MTDYIYDFSSLLGQTITNVAIGGDNDRIELALADGREAVLYHSQECCESVQIEEVIGDWSDIIGSPILLAEEAESQDNPPEHADSFTWTFYKLATVKGHMTIRWLGESSGYYSESVSFIIPKEAEQCK